MKYSKPILTLSITSLLTFSAFTHYQSYKNIKELSEKKQQITNDYQKLKKKHEELQIDLQELKLQNQTLQIQNNKLQQTNQDLLKTINEVNKQKEQSEQEVKNLRKKLETFETVSRGESSRKWVRFLATYYDANEPSTGKNPGDPGYGITASGKRVQTGITVAVDPTIIPLGTWMLIKYPDGRVEKRQAQDTGSAIKGYKIDIYIPKASATSGKHYVDVMILGK